MERNQAIVWESSARNRFALAASATALVGATLATPSSPSESAPATCKCEPKTYVSSPRWMPIFPHRKIQLRHLFTSAALSAEHLNGSIILLRSILSKSECNMLREEADRVLMNEGGSDEKVSGERATRRVALCDTPAEAQQLSHSIILLRVLPTLRREMPSSLEGLDLRGFGDPSAVFEWATDEPAINIYSKGGKFDPHRDGYDLTVIVLLSESGAFEGGGTRFFECSHKASLLGEGEKGDELMEHEEGLQLSKGQNRSSATLKPLQGTAVLFDGAITHAGCLVSSGTRYVYVASFSIKRPEDADGRGY